MSDGPHTGNGATPERLVRTRTLLRKVSEAARREAVVAFPAAKRAASHGLQAFAKKFSEEYAKERRKKRR